MSWLEGNNDQFGALKIQLVKIQSNSLLVYFWIVSFAITSIWADVNAQLRTCGYFVDDWGKLDSDTNIRTPENEAGKAKYFNDACWKDRVHETTNEKS